ncbi:MAG: acyl-CoA thioesterase [bacterium]|nr:acyl-CoA thioesterase [bacterium]
MGDQRDVKLIIKIEWADLDLFGHVNNVAFFRYMQSARIAFCEGIGLSSMHENQTSFMVASSHCDFKKPLRYPGDILVQSNVLWVKNTSFKLGHAIINGSGEISALGEDVLVVFDHLNKVKLPITDSLRESISSYS